MLGHQREDESRLAAKALLSVVPLPGDQPLGKGFRDTRRSRRREIKNWSEDKHSTNHLSEGGAVVPSFLFELSLRTKYHGCG